MKVKFLARGDLLVTVPGTAQFAGQVARYAGRTVDVQTVDGKEVVSYPATQDGVTVDSESSDAARYRKLVTRDAVLFPGDEDTARFCGVPFIPVEFSNGTWSPKAAKAEKGGK